VLRVCVACVCVCVRAFAPVRVCVSTIECIYDTVVAEEALLSGDNAAFCLNRKPSISVAYCFPPIHWVRDI